MKEKAKPASIPDSTRVMVIRSIASSLPFVSFENAAGTHRVPAARVVTTEGATTPLNESITLSTRKVGDGEAVTVTVGVGAADFAGDGDGIRLRPASFINTDLQPASKLVIEEVRTLVVDPELPFFQTLV